jgi:hypothetical protein
VPLVPAAIRSLLLAASLALCARPAVAVVFANPGFDSGVSSWTDRDGVGGTSISWSAMDATGDLDSGSLRLGTSLFFDGPVSECFPAAPLTEYEVSAQVFVPTQAAVPVAAVNLIFYANADCTDGRQIFHYPLSPPIVDTWTELGGLSLSFSMIHSMQVWLYAENESPAGDWVMFFDDITLELAPEPGALGAALAALAALAARSRTSSRAPDPSSRAAPRATPSPCTASRWRRPASCRRA